MPSLPADRPKTFVASDRLVGRAWRVVAARPYVAGSVAVHALLVVALLQIPWGREAVTTVVLRERLHAAAQQDHDRPVRIDGDTRASYQDVVHLLDLCQFEGLTHIAMHTRAGAEAGRRE